MTPSLLEQLVGAWGSWGPSMSPDARRVAYVSDRCGEPQLWVQDIPTGPQIPPAQRIRISDDPVVAVHWSADGDWLSVLVATGGGVRTQVWVVRTDGTEARRVAGSPDQHATLGPWTRHGQRLVVTKPPSHPDDEARCDIVHPASGAHEPLAHGVLVDVLDLSADERFALLRDGTRGQQFVRTLDRVTDQDFPVLPYPRTGTTDAGFFRPSPIADPGVAVVAYVISDAGVARSELVAVPVNRDGTRGSGGAIAARPDADVEFADVDDSGRVLVVVWNVEGCSEIELVDLVSGVRSTVGGLPGEVVTGAVMSRPGDTVMVTVEGHALPRRLWQLDVAARAWQPVTEPGLTVERELVRPSLERFIGYDGLPLSGWLYRAAGAGGADGAASPGPAVVHLHGGPEAQERPTFSAQHQVLAAAGITVFAPNVRGSSGFGRLFMHADDRYGRADSIADVATSAEMLIERGIAAPGRIAVTGRSYGGYLTLAALVWFPELFAAGVDICGMSDLRTFYRDTEAWIAARSVSKYGDPVYDADLLEAVSPLSRLEHVRVPVLVVHGALDTNVPLGEALQVVARLRELGKPVEYLELPGEGHEYRRKESKLALVGAMRTFLTRILAP
jgi:dipeptidyl aminopeptidase/acylaminoacyl peptidase